MVLKRCIPCRRHDSRNCKQATAPLPQHRVVQAPPFSSVGLDYAGPLYIKDEQDKKVYILLFTCSVTRAIHLELTDSLGLNDCIAAVRRFISRRGNPTEIYSDNAKAFRGFHKKLQVLFGPLAPQWKFIVPNAPWWGGYWERMVRNVKNHLKKSIGTKCLDRT